MPFFFPLNDLTFTGKYPCVHFGTCTKVLYSLKVLARQMKARQGKWYDIGFWLSAV